MESPAGSRVRPLLPLQGQPRRSVAALTEVLGTAPAAPPQRSAPLANRDGLLNQTAATTSSAPRERSGGRQTWMDMLRGTAILLVILTHVRAQGDRLFAIDDRVFNVLVDTFYPVRIPLLMLLSGMLLSRSIAKGPRAFTVGKLRGIAWPYLIWSLIYLGVWQMLPHIDGGHHGQQGLTDIVTEPVSVLWYLHLLLGLYLLALALLSIPLARPWHVVSLAAVGWGLAAIGSSPDVERALCLAFFFVSGDLLARRLNRGLPGTVTRLWTSPTRRPVTLIVLFALASPLLFWAVVRYPTRYQPTSLIPVIAAMVLLVLLARAASRTPLEGPLAWIGRQSLVFYVAHWLLIGAWYAVAALVIDPAAHAYAAMGFVFVATLATCAALAWLQQTWRPAGWLFAAPRRRPTDRARVQG